MPRSTPLAHRRKLPGHRHRHRHRHRLTGLPRRPARRALTALTSAGLAGVGVPPVAVLLVVLGRLLAPLALVAVWTNSEVSDTDTYVATVAPLAKEPAVQDAVAQRVTTEIFTRLDIHGITSQAVDALVATTKLPPVVARQLQGLVGTMTQGSAPSSRLSRKI